MPTADSALRAHLESLVASHDRDARRATDPVAFVHRFDDPGDQEVVGLVAATLAFGQVAAIRAAVERMMGVLGARPARFVERHGEAALRRRIGVFRHRVYREDHLARMLARAGRLRRREGSLGAAFRSRLEVHGGDLREGLADFAAELRGESAARGLAHLLPDPRKGSACKRLLLYLRWMVRPADGVDLGLWDMSPSLLVIPVDTHVHRIARNLGLTSRNDASWRTAEEITARLRRLCPEDPTRYDFALCHLGVSRECPSRPDPEKCGRCALRPVCRVWGEGRSLARRPAQAMP